MKRSLKSVLLMLLLALAAVLLPAPQKALAALPTPEDNRDVYLRRYSYLVPTSGGYMRVFTKDDKIRIENYDSDFNLKSKKTLSMELDVWGGFYAGKDAYYLIEGKNNTAESDTAEVIRVIKYSKSWNKLGTAKIIGGEDEFAKVRYPFDYGCVQCAEAGGKLYIVTGHEGYVDPAYNQGHQGFLMVEVDESTMKGKIVAFDLWHSFAQYIEAQDKYLYVLEQSEGSACTALSRYDAETSAGWDYFSSYETWFPVLPYGGQRDSAWAVACRATVDGMALSRNNVLGIGTSIDQSKYDEYDSSTTPYNIYLTVTPKANYTKAATKVKWLTGHAGNGNRFHGVNLTKINSNRFLITWQQSADADRTVQINDPLSGNTLHYIFVDENGNKLTKEFTAAASISDCVPVVKNGKAVFVSSGSTSVNFYTIDGTTGAFSKKVCRVAGNDVTWKVTDKTLKLTGTGAINIKAVDDYGWSLKPFGAISDVVTQVVIGKGITAIPVGCFSEFSALEEATIASTVTKIGKEAFYGCLNLKKVTIPASVTSIGEDAFWTGWHWVGDNAHVVYATIYAPYGSYALKYAKNNDIRYNTILTGDMVSLPAASYTYTGKGILPKVTVKAGTSTLVKGEDYKLSYSSNKLPGTATVKIIGIGDYSGTVTKTFKITKKSVSELTATLEKTSYVYNGKSRLPAVKLMHGKTQLVKGTDYYLSYKNNKKAGTATVIINGKGNYKGSVKKTFTITKAANQIDVTTNYTRKVSSVLRRFALKAQSTGGVLHYSSNNAKVTVSSTGYVTVPAGFKGTAVITVKASGTNYKTVTKKVTFTINP